MSKSTSQSTATASLGMSFDEVVLPHLESAYRLARWITRNEHDAEDVVQEASLRAFRYFRTFAGGNGRAWFLRIVRNTSNGWLGTRRQTDPFDEEQHSAERAVEDPETLLLRTGDVSLIDRTLDNLPKRFRELLILRELEGLSYQELADVMGIPIGTVMSGLSRARQALRGALGDELVARAPDRAGASVTRHADWSPRRKTQRRELSREYARARRGPAKGSLRASHVALRD